MNTEDEDTRVERVLRENEEWEYWEEYKKNLWTMKQPRCN